MSRGYRCALIAVVGWLVCSPISYAQQQTSPTPESQPVAPSQQGNDSAGNQGNAPEKQPEAESLAPALQKIESAIRDIIPPKDESKDQRQENRDKADLQAQEDMARWAKRMFWATVATVIITLAGLALIARTLHHTRRAADYAKDMIAEAKATNDATLALIDQEKINAQRQLRAYVLVEKCYFSLVSDSAVHVAMKIRNFGQTPAYKVNVAAKAQSFKGTDVVRFDKPNRQESSLTLGPNGKFINLVVTQGLHPEITRTIKDGSVPLYIWGEITYVDRFDDKQTTEFRLVQGDGLIDSGGGGFKVCPEGNEST